LVDDDQVLQVVLGKTLKKSYQLVCADTLAHAEKLASEDNFNLVILDICLTDGDGFHFLATIRKQEAYQSIPILVLSGKDDFTDQMMGYQLGVDEWIVKPAHPALLKAKVDARFRNLLETVAENSEFIVGDLRVQLLEQRVFIRTSTEEIPIAMTPLEFKIFQIFAKREEQVFSRDKIIDLVWGGSVSILDRTIDTHVSHIRRKLKNSALSLISVHGVGYKLTKSKNLESEQSAAV
jgi:DNA-binding response OmpR family regulator